MNLRFDRCPHCRRPLENLRAVSCPHCGATLKPRLFLQSLWKSLLFVFAATLALAFGTTFGHEQAGSITGKWVPFLFVVPPRLIVGVIVIGGSAVSAVLLAALHGSRTWFGQWLLVYFLL